MEVSEAEKQPGAMFIFLMLCWSAALAKVGVTCIEMSYHCHGLPGKGFERRHITEPARAVDLEQIRRSYAQHMCFTFLGVDLALLASRKARDQTPRQISERV